MLEGARVLFRRTIRVDKVIVIILVLAVAFVVLSSRRAFQDANAKVSLRDIGVSELIQQLRSDLEKMERARASHGSDAILRIKNVDVELNFVVKVDQQNKNELRFDVVTVGADQGMSLERSDKITLHMEIEPPNWVDVAPTPLSEGKDTKELPSVPLARNQNRRQ